MVGNESGKAGPDGAAAPGRVKGTLLIARMKFLRGQGKISLDSVLEQLSSSQRDVLMGILLPSTWYPSDLLLRLECAIAAVIARGDRARAFNAMGRFSAQANLGPGGVQRPWVREGQPHHLLERVPRMYLSQHSSGRRTYERLSDHSAVIRTYESETTVADDCQGVVGWLERAIELSGGKGVRVVETECRTRGGDHCQFRCDWT